MCNYSKFNDYLQDKLDLYVEEYVFKESVNLEQFIETLVDDPSFCETDMLLRLSKSIINSWDQDTHWSTDTPKDLFAIASHLFDVFTGLWECDTNFLQELMVMLDDKYLRPPIETLPMVAIKHRNVCLILDIALERYQCPLEGQLQDKLVHYLSRIICESEHMQSVLYALYAIEKFPLNTFSEAFKETLQMHGKLVEHSRVSSLYNASFDMVRYQVGFCARWLADHLEDKLAKYDTMPVKLSFDRLSVRVDQLRFPTVRSAFAVRRDVFFFEAVLVTGGSMHIGWTTKQSEFNDWKGIGQDGDSIAFNGAKGVISQNGIQYPVKHCHGWQSGDVIGCLINVPNESFTFYLNGEEVATSESTRGWHFSRQPYYAAASLHSHQQCDFNFGQSTFKYPPFGVEQFSNFYLPVNGDARRYQMIEPTFIRDGDFGVYLHKEGITHNHVDPVFQDETQTTFNAWMEGLSMAGKDCSKNEKQCTFLSLVNGNAHSCLRMMQSIIETKGDRMPDESLQRLVQWISQFLSLVDRSKLPTPGKLIELLYPYMQLCPDCSCEEGVTKHRNICLVLALMSDIYEPSKKLVIAREEAIGEYLRRTLLQGEHKWRLGFALTCARNLASVDLTTRTMLTEPSIKGRITEIEKLFKPAKKVNHFEIVRACLHY